MFAVLKKHQQQQKKSQHKFPIWTFIHGTWKKRNIGNAEPSSYYIDYCELKVINLQECLSNKDYFNI